jgi:GNAT superfamily N-acetyltransferase
MELPAGCRLSVETDPLPADCKVVVDGLVDYNRDFLGDPVTAHFSVFIRGESDNIRGGLEGFVYVDWLFIRYLWVETELRRSGVGRQLVASAEQHSVTLGCRMVHVDTFSFQAPDFYRKLGYAEFGILDYPPDCKRIFFQKQLAAEV